MLKVMSEQNGKYTRSETTLIKKKDESVELLAAGLLQIFQPPLLQVKKDLKELISKQNKTYVDISAEKFHFVDTNVSATEDLMGQIKIYSEKLISIKKQMTTLHHRTKSLKARVIHIQTCKEKELATRIQRRQQEEALIGNKFPTSSNMTT